MHNIIFSIQLFLGTQFNKLYSLTKNYVLSLIIYVLLVYLILFIFNTINHIRNNYSSYINSYKKGIQNIFPKDYALYKENFDRIKAERKYKPRPLIGFILFLVNYGIYLLFFTVIRNPITFICQISPEQLQILKNELTKHNLSTNEFDILNMFYYNQSPKLNINSLALYKINDFSHKFTIQSTPLGEKLNDIKTYGTIIILIVLGTIILKNIINIIKKYNKQKETFKEKDLSQIIFSLFLMIFPALISISLYAVILNSFVLFITFYFIEILILGSIQTKILNRVLPSSKVVNIIHKIKKISDEDINTPEVELSLIKEKGETYAKD